MLDFVKVAAQMGTVGQVIRQGAIASQQKQARALEVLTAMAENLEHYRQAIQAWGESFPFNAAEPIESLTVKHAVPPAPRSHTIFATDGSQIAPSHHEIAYCYLINVGRVAIAYGQGQRPHLDSVPQLVYDPDELGRSRGWGLTIEDWLRYRRTQAEILALVELIQTQNKKAPSLALVDGSLIFWAWESLPPMVREELLTPILAAWDELRAKRIPLVGYVSASRSHETVNFLRLGVCPYPEPNCALHCGQTSQTGIEATRDRPPCQVFDPLRDVLLWQAHLAPQQYSPLWRSRSRILEHYGEHQIYVAYLHGGSEVVRLEVPQWVARDADLWQQAVALTAAQIEKGRGYPVALAEAHNLAVVRGSDRQRFFALLERELIKAGHWHVAPSPKEQRKRQSIA
ncbi:DNA double-strand break repair nuclease NurA [Thermosynechococcus sp. PP45]|uniref:DNA double-strand break repair nuclease NurA n=1 Tax=unclassified Thermosynechococcus TaxID=2622553 RepID=UPI002672CB0F|nr:MULTISPECIES: DNA double-strand break repair nuclease NurA [unclassified Thermosynechococcus]WKT80600.1 DNA double-strand break repair nuclease NurA [Thermosynechococcus sp. PP45]WNC24212.1 DNA double-strand break repair nuclease NurA [Thermosynechococcus sp. PP551]WNC26790.1 DNA double-strand break repair nuclease NurA [Thermosynechococcus sp. PP555]